MPHNDKLIEDARRVLPDEAEVGKLSKVPITKGPLYFPKEELNEHVSQMCFVHFRKTTEGWEFVEVTDR